MHIHFIWFASGPILKYVEHYGKWTFKRWHPRNIFCKSNKHEDDKLYLEKKIIFIIHILGYIDRKYFLNEIEIIYENRLRNESFRLINMDVLCEFLIELKFYFTFLFNPFSLFFFFSRTIEDFWKN